MIINLEVFLGNNLQSKIIIKKGFVILGSVRLQLLIINLKQKKVTINSNSKIHKNERKKY